MIVEFKCPQCGKALQVDGEFSGKKVRCKNCRGVMLVPGTPQVQERRPFPGEEPAEPEEYSEPVPDTSADEESGHESATASRDSSYGIASLYLATFAFLFFFTPAILAGMTGAIGMSIAFFVGIFTNTGCLLLARHGRQLAEKALESPIGQGYAAAGRIVNDFFIKFYALAIVFFVVCAIITLFFAKRFVNQLEGLGGLEKLLPH